MPVFPQQPSGYESLEVQVVAYLNTRNTLTAVLGAATTGDASILRDVIQQDTPLPAIAVQRISTKRDFGMSAGQELVTARLQFTVIGSTAAAVDAVAEQLRIALNRYTGTLPGGLAIVFAELGDERELPYDYDSAVQRRDLDFFFTYAQTYP
jgi:hypothetical protein